MRKDPEIGWCLFFPSTVIKKCWHWCLTYSLCFPTLIQVTLVSGKQISRSLKVLPTSLHRVVFFFFFVVVVVVVLATYLKPNSNRLDFRGFNKIKLTPINPRI